MNLEDQLVQILSDLSLAATETSLIVGSLALLVTGLITKHSVWIKGVFIASLILSFYFAWDSSFHGYFLSRSLTSNHLSVSFSKLLIISTGAAILFNRERHVMEFYFLILALLIGCLFMIKANSFLLVYLSIELVSYVSYTLTAFRFKGESNESAIKYLLFGAMSSSILLIGLGLVYGTTEVFYLSDLGSFALNSPASQIGFVCLLLGVFFKVAIFPFHIWVPGVYQSAPIDAVTIFSVVPKLAGLLLLGNIFGSMDIVDSHWIMNLVFLLGLASILVGTFGALGQKNVRRMVAFGSIAHSGFLLAFVIGPIAEDLLMYYAVIYALMNVGCFYIISHFESHSIFTTSQYTQFSNQSVLLVTFSLILISLIGIPPMAGFTAKFFLFTYLWEWFQDSGSQWILTYLIISVFATVVALFYYLRIPYFYFVKDRSEKSELKLLEISVLAKILATLFGLSLLLLFFVPKLVV